MGDVNGKMDMNFDMPIWGDSIIVWTIIKEKNKGIVIGKINCWVSVSMSEAAPIMAKSEAYIKYPPIKYKRNEIEKNKRLKDSIDDTILYIS